MLPLLNRNPYPDFQGKWFLHDVFFPCGHFQSTFDEIHVAAAATAKLLQSCPTLCDPRDGSPPGSPVPGILQARTLEWVAISFSNAWKWSRSVGSDSSWPHGLQPTRLPRPWDSPGKNTGVGRHFLLQCKKVRSESEDTKLKVVHPQCLVHSLCTTATTSVLLLFSI